MENGSEFYSLNPEYEKDQLIKPFCTNIREEKLSVVCQGTIWIDFNFVTLISVFSYFEWGTHDN